MGGCGVGVGYGWFQGTAGVSQVLQPSGEGEREGEGSQRYKGGGSL